MSRSDQLQYSVAVSSSIHLSVLVFNFFCELTTDHLKLTKPDLPLTTYNLFSWDFRHYLNTDHCDCL